MMRLSVLSHTELLCAIIATTAATHQLRLWIKTSFNSMLNTTDHKPDKKPHFQTMWSLGGATGTNIRALIVGIECYNKTF